MSENLLRDDLFLHIKVVDWECNEKIMSDDSSRHISESLMNYPPTEQEVDKAVRTIISHLRYYNSSFARYNISHIERELTPTKEMTIEEIEKQLGYKVKIVKEK